ncbi:MAG: phosphotransferase [bacterium]|nr:phosphotransferase [bacterium]
MGATHEPFEHGYTNHTVRDGITVLKAYAGPDSSQRCGREVAALRALHGQVPVPDLIETGPDRIRTKWIAGRHGKDLLTAGHDAGVLSACGSTLKQIHEHDISTVFPDASDGSTLIHGDYGPNNILFDQTTIEVVAVLDWEWAHPGDPVEDLAWCEWIIRTFHPDSVGALDPFYAAYGERPSWPSRQSAMLTKLTEMHRFAEQREPGGSTALTRLRQLKSVQAWTEIDPRW